MITSVFSKSRPINYILVTILFVISYTVYQFHTSYSDLPTIDIVKKSILSLALIGSLYLTNFITKKNALSKDNSYTFYLFFIFLILFPNVLSSAKLIISNLFILLALRRLISMHSLITPKEKIFDASLWIFTASLINFWCILFILLVYISIIFHAARDYTNWILPFIALFTVATIAIMLSLAFYPEYIHFFKKLMKIEFKVTDFQNFFENVAIAIYIIIALIAFFSMLIILPKKLSNLHSAYRKVVFAFIIGIAVYMLSPFKSYGYLIYTFVPVSIMLTNLLENTDKLWIKEAIISIVTIASIVTYVLQVF